MVLIVDTSTNYTTFKAYVRGAPIVRGALSSEWRPLVALVALLSSVVVR